jgi:hypothetical protein
MVAGGSPRTTIGEVLFISTRVTVIGYAIFRALLFEYSSEFIASAIVIGMWLVKIVLAVLSVIRVVPAIVCPVLSNGGG